jgi:hypothetical protein
MSEIHIGPHTRDDAAKAHGDKAHGEPHHTFDREIDLKSIGKWMGGLLVLAVIIQFLMWWLLQGMESADRRQDPAPTPIEAEVKEAPPPGPQLQVGPGFSRHNPDALSGSDREEMDAMRHEADTVLSEPAWIDQGQGRLRVPIDVAMQVIASRGAQTTSPQTPAPPAADAAPSNEPAAGAAPPPPAQQEQ